MTPYLAFQGNCEEALNFYVKVFNGKIETLHRYEGSPMEGQIPADFKGKVMHGSMTSPSGTLMASDTSQELTEGSRICLSLNADEAEGQRIFDALAEGGKVTMPLQDVFWGGKFGMVTDKYDFAWMMSIGH
ncbi:MAG: VOC family protein [Candidatus Eremiobacteraeota bacterium]|nr:VOC family protein [Candidatus Eremiobacteraeota bacterium]